MSNWMGMKRCRLGMERPKVGEWFNTMRSWVGISLNRCRSRSWMGMKRMLLLRIMNRLGMSRLRMKMRLRHCRQSWQHLSDAGPWSRGGGGGVMVTEAEGEEQGARETLQEMEEIRKAQTQLIQP